MRAGTWDLGSRVIRDLFRVTQGWVGVALIRGIEFHTIGGLAIG